MPESVDTFSTAASQFEEKNLPFAILASPPCEHIPVLNSELAPLDIKSSIGALPQTPRYLRQQWITVLTALQKRDTPRSRKNPYKTALYKENCAKAL